MFLPRRAVVLARGLNRCQSTLVTSEIVNNIGIITLNDPKRLNALTANMGEQFVAHVNNMNEVLAACVVTIFVNHAASW